MPWTPPIDCYTRFDNQEVITICAQILSGERGKSPEYQIHTETFHRDTVIGSFFKITSNKMCLWNTMPPIMANSNEGQDHKDKYFDASRKILSQEMTMCNMEALVSYFSELMTNVIFFLIGQKSRSKD